MVWFVDVEFRSIERILLCNVQVSTLVSASVRGAVKYPEQE